MNKRAPVGVRQPGIGVPRAKLYDVLHCQSAFPESTPCTLPARRRYTLEQLLAQCDFSKRLGKEERDWLDAPRAGREAI